MPSRRKKPRSARKMVATVAAMVVAILGLIALARARKHEIAYVFPEEREARIAKRTSPDNAYPLLMKALAALPAKPGEDMASAWWQRHSGAEGEDDRRSWWRELDCAQLDPPNLASLCWIAESVSEERIVQYARDNQPVISQMQAALAKPFAMPETPQSPDRRYIDLHLMQLGRNAVALGRVQFVEQGTAESLAPLVDAVRCARMLSGEDNLLRVSQAIETAAWQQVRFLAARHDHLDVLQAAIDGLGPAFTPRASALHMLYRTLDDQAAGISYGPGLRSQFFLFRNIFRDDLQPVIRAIRENREALDALAEQSPKAFRGWLEERFPGRSGVESPFSLAHQLAFGNQRAAELGEDYAATQIAVALERTKMETGSYPETLAALTPKFLSALPADPVVGKATYIYNFKGDSYSLVSLGGADLDKDGKLLGGRVLAGTGL